ncbi:transposon tf2-9 polyprotein [Plakobranchus ocellatus]|uniref:Transposon tf2-9 polyprotein n=1 Tax=Plakobranchus ocellatus TaxID=259542 RepID=A0AAV4AV11_9GAST|nr:transposon tf2-9 polyprotein [Plakobranchus ocellatus]
MERFKFHKRNQNSSESISEFCTAIKKLSEHCNFGETLKMALRDRFVCGLRDVNSQKRLLQEQNLTLETATNLALAMETAQKDAVEMQGQGPTTADLHVLKSKPHQKGSKHASSKFSRSSHSSSTFPPCLSCGKTNHKRSDCYFKDATCNKCHKKGHIQSACKSGRNKPTPNNHSSRRKIHELNEQTDEQFTLELFQLGERSPKILVPLKVEGTKIDMELDTGAAVTAMTKADFMRIFKSEPQLQKTSIKLKTYTNEVITPLGQLQVKVEKARPIPYALKKKVEQELDNLERQGIISSVKSSDWATPIVPVLKANGDVRLCGDYKTTVNPNLYAEKYTLPRMEDMLAQLEQGEKFSKIDLRQAYLQLPLDEASKSITTINTSKGLYSYNRLPFGITSSPAIWQKTMDSVLQGIPGVQCNQDDMLVTGNTDEEHYQNLHSVLRRLQQHGLKANLQKCSFFQPKVLFCGISITKDGLHKTEDKIKAVTEAPPPTDKTQLRSFLGLVNYYHKWLKNVAHIAKPLYNLLQDNKHFSWSTECQKAFKTIKSMVASDNVLMRYDPDLSLRLATDASPYGLGAVLSHVTREGDERLIAYASRTLNKAEGNYSQIDKEGLSIVWAVKKFFNYLCGRHFTLITDHQPLKFIFSPSRGIPAILLVPQKLHKQILNMLHDGHLGIVRMKNLARSHFWWPGLDKDIEKMAKSCSGCAMSQTDPLLTPLHPWRWPDKPWQRIHIDYAGPFLNFMFLVIVDAHTKWVEIIPTATSTSSATINILSTTFARYGIPEQVVSDNGPQFTSEDFRAFMSSNGIKHTRSALYHPATNGLAERMVQSFKNAMKAAKHDEGSIHLKLTRFLLAYRNSPHSTTGESPASLMFGRRLRTRLDICTPSIQTHVTGKLQKQEQHHSQASPRTFSTGDHVLVRDYRGYERWQHGQISSQTGTHNYEIEISPGVIWRRHSDQIVLASNPVPPPQATVITLPVAPPIRPQDVQIPGQSSTITSPETGDSTLPPQESQTCDTSMPSDRQSERDNSDKCKHTVTRSGRVVRLPNRYKK